MGFFFFFFCFFFRLHFFTEMGWYVIKPTGSQKRRLPCSKTAENLANLPHLDMSQRTTKPIKWMCAQRRLKSAWASAQSDQFSAVRSMGS